MEVTAIIMLTCSSNCSLEIFCKMSAFWLMTLLLSSCRGREGEREGGNSETVP